MSSTCRNNGGFTLLEVLLALALLVILSGALYGTYFSVMRGQEVASAGMERRRELSTTMEMLRREIASCYFNKDNKRCRFVVEDRDIFGKPASTLEMTTITPPNDLLVTVSDLMTVRYAPKEKEETITLTREARDLYLDTKPYAYPQMDEIEGFLVECYDGNKWLKSWDTAINAGGLPKSVRVTLTMKQGGKPVAFTTLAAPMKWP